MSDSLTPNLGLTKPGVGSSQDSWGAKANHNYDLIDAAINSSMPIGALLDYAGAVAPAGWILCDGRTISRTTYSGLFAVIGITFGAGDGSTTFAVPDCRGRITVGVGTGNDGTNTRSFSAGQKGGLYQGTLTAANLPANAPVTISSAPDHAHSYAVPAAYGPAASGGGPGDGMLGWQTGLSTGNAGGHTHTASLSGGGQPVDITNPSIAVNKIIYAGGQAMLALSGQAAAQRTPRAPMRGGG